MATVTQLLDRAANISGLAKTGTERQLALLALQNTYLDTVMRTACAERIKTVSPTTPLPGGNGDDFNLATLLGESPLKLSNVVIRSSNTYNYPLVHVSEDELLEYRRGFQAR